MAAQPGNEGTVRHIQFDENGDEIEDIEHLQTADEDLQDVDDDDQEVVEVGSGTKKRKKKGASSKSSRKSTNSPFMLSGLQGPGRRVRTLSKQPTALRKKKNINQVAQATADYLFAKQQASDSFKLPSIPLTLYEELKQSPVIAWRKLMNVFAVQQTDSRLQAKAFLRSMPDGFFNTPETSMIAKAGDTDAAFKTIKDTVFARYTSLTDPDDVRNLLNLVKFSTAFH